MRMGFTAIPDLLRRAHKLRNWRTILQQRQFDALRTEFYEALWTDAAARVGAVYEAADYGFRGIRRDGLITFVRRSEVMLDDLVTNGLMANKHLTYQLMTRKGCRIAPYCVFDLPELDRALDFLHAQGGGIVIKPASGTGAGRGVTTGVRTEAQLRRAARRAAGYSRTLLAERMLTGRSFRLLYIGSEFCDAVRRDPPSVVGDGRHTIGLLVEAENQRRWSQRPLTALNPLVIDDDAINHLTRHGLSARSKPADGEVVEIKIASNENAAPQNHNVREQVHPEIVAAGARLVKDLGIGFAGIDLISENISAPFAEGLTWMSEINVNPGIHHHYLIADPARGVPVAERLLEYMFTRNDGVIVL